IKSLAADVCDRRVRQIEIVDAPGRRIVRESAPLALPEEYQLEPIAFSGGVAQVAGVVPPFRAKGGMLEVIARKGIAITGRRAAIGLDVPGWSADRAQDQGDQGRQLPAPATCMRGAWAARGIHRSKHP